MITTMMMMIGMMMKIIMRMRMMKTSPPVSVQNQSQSPNQSNLLQRDKEVGRVAVLPVAVAVVGREVVLPVAPSVPPLRDAVVGRVVVHPPRKHQQGVEHQHKGGGR
jgi:hypothetical protein